MSMLSKTEFTVDTYSNLISQSVNIIIQRIFLTSFDDYKQLIKIMSSSSIGETTNSEFKRNMDTKGIEPLTARMQSERSTPELRAHCNTLKQQTYRL
jgi:hypothetical protein